MISLHTHIIRLKKEFKEQYIALHKHTFPDVLKRIALSNIRNYSIFLYDNILFSYYEYFGENYKKDIQDIGDKPTLDWWALTEIMQEPFNTRDKDDWWSKCDIIYKQKYDFDKGNVKRKVFVTKLKKAILNTEIQPTPALEYATISTFKDFVFIYFEVKNGNDIYSRLKTIEDFFSNYIIDNFKEMEEVFYTNMEHKSQKKVFISGCFDMLHSGHIAFIREAASYGDLYVGIGSDETIRHLKGKYPINTQDERMYMISALKFVKECRVNKSSGILDFIEDIDEIKPDVFIVNEDGNTPQKAQLCKDNGIEYVVLKRIPHANLPRRSTTDLRKECSIPYRIDLAGGWLDQPFVSKYSSGSVITISIEPSIDFNYRSGMATSTRNKAIELWNSEIPNGNKEQLAKMLFSFENSPGVKHISGSQDALGIVLPFLNKLNYNGDFWTNTIETVRDETVLKFLEDSLFLIPLGPRKNNFDVMKNTNICSENAKKLSEAAECCWQAIIKKDIKNFSKYFTNSFLAQIAMFPNMTDESIFKIIEQYKNKALGWKISGSGGGGYLIFVSDKNIDGSIKIKIRRGDI